MKYRATNLSKFTQYPCQTGRIKSTDVRYIALNFKEISSEKIRSAVFFENSFGQNRLGQNARNDDIRKEPSFGWYYVCQKVNEDSLPTQIDNKDGETDLWGGAHEYAQEERFAKIQQRLEVFKSIVDGTNREFQLATAEELAE